MTKAKILLVDDRPENLLTLENLLDDLEVELVSADSGAQALSCILDQEFALVLLDVQMPDMDGYEVAELMRGNKKTRHIPIIFVTAATRSETQIFKGYESGAVDYLSKPLNPQVLKSKVAVFIELFEHKAALHKKTLELDQKLAEMEELQQQLEETNEQLLMLSTTDSLTGVYNRRRFDEICAEEWVRCRRNQQPLSLLMLDIDHFKAFNDTYGHAAGDDCLKTVSMAISKALIRESDNLARIGGEEFAIILPNTDRKGALQVGDRIRHAITEQAIGHKASTTHEVVTISVGIASTNPNDHNSIPQLMKAADNALYVAKNQGRNRCCVAQDSATAPSYHCIND